MLDIRQTPQYAKYLSEVGWIVERIGNTNYFIKKIPILGNIIKIQRPGKIYFKDIEKLVKKYKPFQIIIEPSLTGIVAFIHDNLLHNQGFRQSESSYLPSKTLFLDLTKSKKILFNNLEKDCKYAINRPFRITIKDEENIRIFRECWKKAVGFKRYVPPLSQLTKLKKSFGDNSLFLLEQGGNAGAIFLLSDDAAYYWQAFTNKVGRKLLAQYKIVWRGILWAKEKGAKIFDFEGIFDKRYANKSWLGFSHFKNSFGGKEIEYPGCFIKTNIFRIKT